MLHTEKPSHSWSFILALACSDFFSDLPLTPYSLEHRIPWPMLSLCHCSICNINHQNLYPKKSRASKKSIYVNAQSYLLCITLFFSFPSFCSSVPSISCWDGRNGNEWQVDAFSVGRSLLLTESEHCFPVSSSCYPLPEYSPHSFSSAESLIDAACQCLLCRVTTCCRAERCVNQSLFLCFIAVCVHAHVHENSLRLSSTFGFCHLLVLQ